jgi:hypothetical protein
LTNIIEKIFKKSRMHSIFIFRLSDLICEFSFELMSFAVIIIIKYIGTQPHCQLCVSCILLIYCSKNLRIDEVR